jgi:DNA-directed RNA polymerase specialized sigma24 family protein
MIRSSSYPIARSIVRSDSDAEGVSQETCLGAFWPKAPSERRAAESLLTNQTVLGLDTLSRISRRICTSYRDSTLSARIRK